MIHLSSTHGGLFSRPYAARIACATLLSLLLFAAVVPARAAAPKADEAEQLRLIAAMATQMRARLDQLTVLIPSGHAVGTPVDVTARLNADPVLVEGRRFDAVVITAPEAKASFAWAFATPTNAARWYVLRADGDMQGFRDFVRRPRANLPGAGAFQPEAVPQITLQKLDAAQMVPGARYVLWFEFKDAEATEVSFRAAFLPQPSLTNTRLPGLLFPAPAPGAKS